MAKGIAFETLHNGNFKIKIAKQIAEIMGSFGKIRKKEAKPKALSFL